MGKVKYNLNKDEIFDLYINQNKNLNELSELYNIPIITIQRFLRKYNIKKHERKDYTYLHEKILKMLNSGMKHQDIADKIGISRDILRYILYNDININNNSRYSNCLFDESWINFNNPIFWYILGIITSDGHINEKSNTISIFQSDQIYLNRLQKYINHSGRIYKKIDSEMSILMITSEKLYNILKSFNLDPDKRYNAPFIFPENKEMTKYYIRGLFDGDGCLYYAYTSGVLDKRTWQITSGSELIVNGVKKVIEDILDINLNVYNKISTTNSTYYNVNCLSINDIILICEWIYSGDILQISLMRKYKSFIKLKNLIELNKQVNDIVDTTMKIVD